MSRTRAPWPLVAALLLGALAPAAGAGMPEEVFEQANADYERGRYEEAAEGYRSLLRYQIRDPRLEYNLANAEFRLGRLGHAVLHYERARRLDPTDPDIRANLEYARSLCFDKVETPPPPAGLAWILALQDRLGPDRQAWCALVWVWAAAGWIAWCSARPRGWRGAAGWVLSAWLLAAALCGLSWYVTLARLEAGDLAVVLDPAAEVFTGPGQNNAVLVTVHEGLTLRVVGEREDWLQVRLPNGFNGWIGRPSVGLVG